MVGPSDEMVRPDNEIARVLKLLEGIPDPEVPVLTILDLGIVRDVQVHPSDERVPYAADGSRTPTGLTVLITPTYTGCPAMDMIRMSIRITLAAHGYDPVDIRTTLSPPWTTEWLSETAKQKLEAFGIAPPNPVQSVCHPGLFQQEEAVRCPRCQSYHTGLVSRFGSTACKALYRCYDCHEPFDYFKCH
jgi:ring-1,2-phenylacetyl-CoA epoxidase subunit PaaD